MTAAAWGGARPGAGRKRLARRKSVPHRTRPAHREIHPMHITLRRIPLLPSFRKERIREMVLRQIHRLNDKTFQIVHFSIQANHLHLIVEADTRETITKKMMGFAISFAKRLNAHVLRGRRGKVWSDRYFRRDVVGAGEMNNVLRYVFGNAKRHGVIPPDAAVLDDYSSAWTFDGWDVKLRPPVGVDHWPRPHPRTRLLRIDWIGGGLLPIAAAPRALKR